jgi:hypothetical protein
VTNDDWPYVLLHVGLMVQVGPIQCLLMPFDPIFLVILETDLSEDSKGGMVEIMLPVDIEKRLRFWCESSGGDHLCSIECFAHGYLLEVFYVAMEDELVFSRGKDCAAEVLDLDHVQLLKIMPTEATC